MSIVYVLLASRPHIIYLYNSYILKIVKHICVWISSMEKNDVKYIISSVWDDKKSNQHLTYYELGIREKPDKW